MYFFNTLSNGDISSTVIKKLEVGILNIHADEENPDYIEYLEWVAAGNTAELWVDNGN